MKRDAADFLAKLDELIKHHKKRAAVWVISGTVTSLVAAGAGAIAGFYGASAVKEEADGS